MAQFTNTARLTYQNTVINSNVARGEILETLSASKTAVTKDYTRNDEITYVISALNSGTTAVTALSVTDDLGAYPFGESTLVPLDYVTGSVLLYINGTLQAAPTVTVGPPLTFSGINIPAGGNMILVYEATANRFAPLSETSSIVNTATLTSASIPTPITVTETATPSALPVLTITKSVEPTVVTENGSITYRFVIQNSGNAPADASASILVSDVFDPILSALAVTLDGVSLSEGTDYTYDEASGTFATVAGVVTVPAATYEQDATTGEWIITPGITILSLTGTV